MAKNLVNGTNIIIEENANNINLDLSSTYTNNLTQQINDSFKENNVYSTTETVIGKWIDNKPIYRTVISLPSSYTNTSPGSRTITHNLGIETYTNVIIGSLKYSGQAFPIPRIARDGNNIGVSTISENSIILDVATAITTYSNLILVLEYTKTTD